MNHELKIALKKVQEASDKAQLALDASQTMPEVINRAMEEGLRKIFGEKPEDAKFINVGRIPLICKDIADIKEHSKSIDVKIDSLQRAIYLAMGGGTVIIFAFPFLWNYFVK